MLTERENLVDIHEELGKLANRLQASLAFCHSYHADTYVAAVADVQAAAARLHWLLSRLDEEEVNVQR